MIYIEFITRLPGVSLEDYHRATTGQNKWADENPEDVLVLNIARTWRLGPEPGCFAVWHTPRRGFHRLDDWEHQFATAPGGPIKEVFRGVARIQDAGCYQPLVEPIRTRGRFYYAEFFRATGGDAEIREAYERRAAAHPNLQLCLLVRPIGGLAPEPGGLAVWSLPTLADSAALTEELAGWQAPVKLHRAGLYADVGKEVL